MDCSHNDFCSSLPAETRHKLCAKCRRRFFKAQSMQLQDDYTQTCMLILDGVTTSSTNLGEKDIDHDTEVPILYFGLPGRLLQLHVTFGYEEMIPAIAYSNFHYLTDTWLATFSHHTIWELCQEDEVFRLAVYRNMVALVTDCCRTSALFRANYLYFGLYHLISMLSDRGQYLNQQQLSRLLNHDRTSISKALSRFKKEHPDLWANYASNKNREFSQPYPES